MIGYLVLVVIQFAVAFVGAPFVLRYIPITGDPQTFVHAAIYAVLVWIVGLVGCFVLKEVRMPTTGTLASALIGAMIGAALMLFPQLIAAIPFKFPPLYLPLIGAILGYLLRR
ncbi:MAG: hypothetical protein H6876_01620 [Hyphomicrobiaceae bacterium]|nr:hypothetical protein [Hyphomicrobiaceae bacterium]MCC0006810.1 hypothetical protein [Hyphomicrobiaceae bacterium]